MARDTSRRVRTGLCCGRNRKSSNVFPTNSDSISAMGLLFHIPLVGPLAETPDRSGSASEKPIDVVSRISSLDWRNHASSASLSGGTHFVLGLNQAAWIGPGHDVTKSDVPRQASEEWNPVANQHGDTSDDKTLDEP